MVVSACGKLSVWSLSELRYDIIYSFHSSSCLSQQSILKCMFGACLSPASRLRTFLPHTWVGASASTPDRPNTHSPSHCDTRSHRHSTPLSGPRHERLHTRHCSKCHWQAGHGDQRAEKHRQSTSNLQARSLLWLTSVQRNFRRWSCHRRGRSAAKEVLCPQSSPRTPLRVLLQGAERILVAQEGIVRLEDVDHRACELLHSDIPQ